MSQSLEDQDLITVTQATKEDRPVIFNLVQLMLYDLSHLYGEWIGRDGRYPYKCLDIYWTEQDRHPYVICHKDQLAGFALVSAHSPFSTSSPCWFMNEFFVLKAQRRRGYGQRAMRELILRHPGDWEIAAIEKNQVAVSFWAKTLPSLPVSNLQTRSRSHDGFEWVVYTFASGETVAVS